MRFLKQEVLNAEAVQQIGAFDIAFYGNDQLDDRSRESAKLSKNAAKSSFQVSYDAKDFTLTIGDESYRSDDLESIPLKYPCKSIVFDATTMEFPEIALLLYAYRHYSPNLKPGCTFIYVEPAEYVKNEQAGSDAIAFQLSDSFGERRPIPQFAPALSANKKAHLVAFLGFEGTRVLRVLQDDDGNFYRQVTVVFGVPPFQSSWDLHSLMANTNLLTYSSPQVSFSGANDPLSAYLLLGKVQSGLLGSGCSRLAVAPFGTKPTAIGVALYCVENQIMRVIYDYPVRKKGRTKGVHCVHRYAIEWQ
ncbi:hypothetical protein R70006_03217 [Paraburkholderia domus]|uniref:hypothetical protein n=1 Tax=Paraburkholderia domus TaxID=2793075 RepID=UPI0019120D07|nr:hypothetical protein [Paraburkholderia domus]MBK5050440.1 hypothetical protein [Burkholderia sp. R-70006]CAE6755031.1 hypothetical protein R70006_03217 [Paraburkholderia domus]